MTAREPVCSFWEGDELPPLEWACLRSFVERGHLVRLFAYRELTVPNGVALEDAADIVPAHELFLLERSPSAFSNIFRYQLLHELGGWWVDTDVQCRTESLPSCRYAWAEQEPGVVNGAILKFPKRDPICGELLALSKERARTLTHYWGQLGPELLTERLGGKRPDDRFGSRGDFYPLHWLQAHLFWLPEARARVAARCTRALFVHMWSSVFAQMGIDTRRMPPADSFFVELYRGCPGVVPSDPQVVEATRQSIRRYFSQDWIRPWWLEHCGGDPATLDFDLALADLVAGVAEPAPETGSRPTADH